MLNNRLTALQKLRCPTGTSRAILCQRHEHRNGRTRRTIFVRHGEPRGVWVAEQDTLSSTAQRVTTPAMSHEPRPPAAASQLGKTPLSTNGVSSHSPPDKPRFRPPLPQGDKSISAEMPANSDIPGQRVAARDAPLSASGCPPSRLGSAPPPDAGAALSPAIRSRRQVRDEHVAVEVR